MPSVGHTAQWNHWLPKAQKKYRQSALLVWIHGPVWTCSIKKRKYKHVIQIARVVTQKWNGCMIYRMGRYGPYDNMNYFDQMYNIWDGGENEGRFTLGP